MTILLLFQRLCRLLTPYDIRNGISSACLHGAVGSADMSSGGVEIARVLL